ncbi:uncharacterized protein DS421_5g156140 [Arachis hypogaea]|nr:uncharacterized protein DS421_5g156140 [Arachis hypogaea]
MTKTRPDRVGTGRVPTGSGTPATPSFSVKDSFFYAACCTATEGLAPSSCSTMAHVSVWYHLLKSQRHPQRGFRVRVGLGGTPYPAG